MLNSTLTFAMQIQCNNEKNVTINHAKWMLIKRKNSQVKNFRIKTRTSTMYASEAFVQTCKQKDNASQSIETSRLLNQLESTWRNLSQLEEIWVNLKNLSQLERIWVNLKNLSQLEKIWINLKKFESTWVKIIKSRDSSCSSCWESCWSRCSRESVTLRVSRFEFKLNSSWIQFEFN